MNANKSNKDNNELEKKRNREKEIKERMDILERLDFLGADAVIEYRGLKKELKKIQQVTCYDKWFEDNRVTLKYFFDVVAKDFMMKDKDEVFYPLSKDGEYILLHNGEKINATFLIELLRRYGYSITIEYLMGAPTKMKIYL